MAAGIGRGAEVARAGREISLEVLGLRLAALRYGDAASPHKVALVHGWMDNAGSWARIAPHLPGDVVAVDLPGHGQSEHLSRSADYTAPAHIGALAGVLTALGWINEETLVAARPTAVHEERIYGLLGRPRVPADVAAPEAGGARFRRDEAHDPYLKHEGGAATSGGGSGGSGGDGAAAGLLPAGVESISLVGHSMGGAIVTSLAAALGPSVIRRVVTIEGMGFLSKPPERIASVLLEGLRSRARTAAREKAGRAERTLPDVDAAVEARIASVASYPGQQYLSREAARPIVERGVVAVAAAAGPGGAGGLRFSHDPRLRENSLTYLSEAHVLSVLAACRSPSLLVAATKGWPWPEDVLRARVDALSPAETLLVESSHHCHLEPETEVQVRDAIIRFLQLPAAADPPKL